MKIIPLAAESMGVRSMATFVETEDCRVIIDPGAIVRPFRFGLTPHPMEEWCLKKHLRRIKLFIQSSNIIIITHYHTAHFLPEVFDLYRNKILLLKNPNQKISVSQRNRAFEFLRVVQGLAREVSYIDGRTLNYGNTQINFSPPVPHDKHASKGFVVQVAFHEMGKTFLFSSDVQGPCLEEPVDFLLNQNPELLYLDGPVTHLQGDSNMRKDLSQTMDRIQRIIEESKVLKIIIDHHLLRDLQWNTKIKPIFNFARQRGILIQTAAEFRGEENNLLEARRKQLYEEDPP